jgi:hypothetical protein
LAWLKQCKTILHAAAFRFPICFMAYEERPWAGGLKSFPGIPLCMEGKPVYKPTGGLSSPISGNSRYGIDPYSPKPQLGCLSERSCYAGRCYGDGPRRPVDPYDIDALRGSGMAEYARLVEEWGRKAFKLKALD